MEHGADRQAHLREVTDKLRIKMEAQSLRVRDLVLTQPPIQLLGYLQAQLHMGFAATSDEPDESARPKHKDLIKTYQFALEYVHAVWCCHADLPDESTRFDEQKAGDLLTSRKTASTLRSKSN